MALHLTPIRPSTYTASVVPSARRAAVTAKTAPTRSVRSPEEASLPTFHSITAAATSAAQASTSASSPSDGMAAFKALFSGVGTNVATPTAAATPAPTAQSAFGANPWLDNPTGMAPDGSTYGYNQQYFATPQTAQAVAQMLGGTVVQVKEMTSAPGSTFQQQQPNQMVRLPNGALINPGLVAGFYTHGYPQSTVDQMIANEVANVSA